MQWKQAHAVDSRGDTELFSVTVDLYCFTRKPFLQASRGPLPGVPDMELCQKDVSRTLRTALNIEASHKSFKQIF